MRINRRLLCWIIVIAAATPPLIGFALPRHAPWPPRLLYNHTPSVPVGFYWFDDSPSSNIQRGDLVAFALPKTAQDYAHRRGESTDVLLLKPVLAISGDRVSTLHGKLRVNDALVGPIPQRDSAGRTLPHWRADRVLKTGELFVVSTRIPNSFDSRFFGPIHVSQVVGVYRPLWTCHSGKAPLMTGASLPTSQRRRNAAYIPN